MKHLAYIVILVALSSCAGLPYSENERIAEIQRWSQACLQMGQVIQTATFLGRSGNLTEDEERAVDRIDAVYRPVCTGDPGPLNEIMRDVAVQTAVKELCPELVPGIPGGALVTVTQAAACAARKALILQLGSQS